MKQNGISAENNRTKPAAIWTAADWPLLLFIIGVTNVKLYVKFAAVILYLLYFLYKKYPLRRPLTGVMAFYLLMPVVGVVGALLHGSFSDGNYKYTYLFGAAIWLLAAAASWLIYLSVRRISYHALSASLKIYFALNLAVSLAQLIFIMCQVHNIMPYWYADAAGKYGVSTGDYISGITGNACVVNSVIATLGIMFFYFQKAWGCLAVCLLTMVLCTSNLTLLCLLFILIVMAVLVKEKGMRMKALVLIVGTIAVYWFVSPKNVVYIAHTFSRLFSSRPHHTLSGLEKYYKEHREAFLKVSVNDTIYDRYTEELGWLKMLSGSDTMKRHSLLSGAAIDTAMHKWYGHPPDSTPLAFVRAPGKLYSFKQSFFYLFSAPQNCVVGAGIGNFSSRLAVKTTGLGMEGSYPGKYTYAGKDFFSYHFYDILYYFSRPEEEHSVMNMPDSVYNQLAGEYGLAGLLLFFVCYLGYFWKKRSQMGYGRYILGIILLLFGYEYWFEMITVTVFFELLMFMDIFATERKDGDSTASYNSINAGI